MHIHSLYLKDFKTIKEHEFLFDKINLISGDTGEGKSAVTEALTFGLTGELDDTIAEYVRWGQDKFIIDIHFEHHNTQYKYIIEGIKKSSSTNRVLIIDGVEDSKGTEAVKKLSEIIDPKITLYSNVSMQHKTTELLQEKPTSKLQKLKKILKVDELNKPVEKIAEDKEEVKQKITTVKAELDILSNKTFSYHGVPDLPDINIRDLRTANDEMEKDKDLYNAELIEHMGYKVKKGQYDKAVENIKEWTLQLNVFIKESNAIGKKIVDIPDFDTELFEELKSKKAVYDSNKTRKERLNKELSGKEEDLIVLPKPKRLKPCDVTDHMVNESEEAMQDSISDYKYFYKMYETIQKGQCPTCGAEYGCEDIEKHKKDVEDYKKVMEDSKVVFRDLENKVSEYVVEFNENNELKRKRKLLEEAIDKIKEDLLTLNTDFNEGKYIELIELKKIVDHANKTNDGFVANLNDVKAKKSSIEAKLEEGKKVEDPGDFSFTVEYDIDTHEKIKDDIQDYEYVEKEVEHVRDMNASILKEEDENKANIINVQVRYEEHTKKERLLKEVEKILDKTFAAYLIDKGTAFLQEKMNEFFSRSYGKYSVKFQQKKSGLEYFYSENGEDLHSTSTLSGYEKCVFSVAQRIAMSALQDLNFIVCDEIDSDASSEKSMALYKTLLDEGFEQYFVITHNDFTKEYLENEGAKLFNIHKGGVECIRN